MDKPTDQGSGELQRQLSTIFETAAEGIILIDKSGRVEVFSRAAERTFGYTAQEVVGRNVGMLMPSPDGEQHDGYIRKYLDSRVPKIIGTGREVTGMRKDGSLFPLYLSVGEVTRGEKFVGIIRDLTETKRADEERRRLQERLAHAGRVRAMGEIATNIAHEVSQPLTAIASYAQACKRMLERQADVDGGIVDAVDKIGQQALRGGHIIERLREFLRQHESKSEVSDINALVAQVSDLYALQARQENVVMTFSLAEDLPEIFVDRIQIQQVIFNLVSNAIEATTGNKPNERAVELQTSLNETGDIIIRISDNGPGLSNEAATKAFEPFFTTKQSGMGVGLAICRTIVEAHGGKVWFSRTRDTGATVCFTLPRYRNEEDHE
jgi:two-component system sensor kinase FixL